MTVQKRSPSRLTHTEGRAVQAVAIKDVAKGDVFVREGTPCMRVEVPTDYANPPDSTAYIINLTNGSVWPTSADEMVYPAIDVRLSFNTSRGDML